MVVATNGIPATSAATRAEAVVALLAAAPEDPAGVSARLDRLQGVLDARPRGAEDGVACFNLLYRCIVRDVCDQLAGQDLFRDPELTARTVVELARRYFAALRADAAGSRVPRSWRVLFERRADPRIGPVEFAVCGANAHVNYDFAQAIVRACTVLGRPGLGAAEHADYQALNAVFARNLARLREHLRAWLGREIDGTYLEGLLDGAGSLTVVMARDATWRRAEHLWDLRSRPAEYERECEAIDWRAAMMGRGVLSIGAL